MKKPVKKAPSEAKRVAYTDPVQAKILHAKRRNFQRNKVWNEHFNNLEVEFKTMSLQRAQEMMSALLDEYTLTPDLRIKTR